jgi:hypothetical protein
MAQRTQPPAQPRPTPDTVYYRASDLRVLGTETELRRNHMRAVGTGEHPGGYYLEGQVVDLPEVADGRGGTAIDPSYQDLVDKGWVTILDPEDDPGRTVEQIAGSIQRGDTLAHPVDADIARNISDEEAYAIVQTGDRNAEPSELLENDPERHAQLAARPVAGAGRSPLTPRAVARHQRETEAHEAARGSAGTRTDGGSGGGEPDGPDATDSAVAAATEAGIDLAEVTGTGQNGRITKDDVDKAIADRDGS